MTHFTYNHYDFISSKTDSKVIGTSENKNLSAGYSSVWSRYSKYLLGLGEYTSVFQEAQSNLYKLTSGVDICLRTLNIENPHKFSFFVVDKRHYPRNIVSYYDIPVSANLLIEDAYTTNNLKQETKDDIAFGQCLSHISMRTHCGKQDFFDMGELSDITARTFCYCIEQFIGQRQLISKLPGFLPYITVFNNYTYHTESPSLQKYKEELFYSLVSNNKQINGKVLLLFIIYTLYSEGQYLNFLNQNTIDAINKHTQNLLNFNTCKERINYIDKEILPLETETIETHGNVINKKVEKIFDSYYEMVGKVIDDSENELMEYLSNFDYEEEETLNQSVAELAKEAARYPNKTGVKKPYISKNGSVSQQPKFSNGNQLDHLDSLANCLKERLSGLNKMIEQEEINLYSGELDQGALEKIAYKSDKLFKRNTDPTYQSLDIIILIDESGSMSNGILDECVSAAQVIHEAVKDVKNLECYIYGQSSHEDGEELLVKRYCNTKTNPDVSLLCGVQARCENYDSWAMLETVYDYLELSDQQQQRNTILFMLSDGTPEGRFYGGDAAIKHVQECVTFLESKFKIKTFGIGLANAYSKDIGKRLYGNNRSIVLGDDLSELIDIIPAQIQRELSK